VIRRTQDAMAVWSCIIDSMIAIASQPLSPQIVDLPPCLDDAGR
jgi:hypothetical protein